MFNKVALLTLAVVLAACGKESDVSADGIAKPTATNTDRSGPQEQSRKLTLDADAKVAKDPRLGDCTGYWAYEAGRDSARTSFVVSLMSDPAVWKLTAADFSSAEGEWWIAGRIDDDVDLSALNTVLSAGDDGEGATLTDCDSNSATYLDESGEVPLKRVPSTYELAMSEDGDVAEE